ncbi:MULTISPECIES: hypothetical protein [unclassified Bradyrhizobium]|uniref:hypothetical protein n=1 Tax=unclassified Bradyrhizobium TaxID=2631580 RepID=UPI001FF197EF|nr:MULTISPECIES: hypothetical protein [unclassified Bradyrhizobium]MCJ9704042.1 hypothetical protein [Bradyrhizobium sp. SHOUNA76]MCJ9732102.1 hypothetical protein [Bradyrhizobium sp. PRIMUS42]
MGIRAFVFDERAAPEHVDYHDWIQREIEGDPRGDWSKPETSSPPLRKWFDDMRSSFPLIGDAHPDDAFGTEYGFYKNAIDVVFASSVGEEAVLRAWKLADKHGLRLSVGGELLPRKAPKTSSDFHVTALHGSRPDTLRAVLDVCFVVFDPDIAHVAPSGARMWVLEQLQAAPWSKDRSILTGDRLRRWLDQYESRNLDELVSEMRFYRDLIFMRVEKRNSSSMVSPTMELAHKFSLPLEIYVDIA